MTQDEKLEWVTTLVASLASSEFYGQVTIQISKGDITIARVEQTVKPARKKSWREMNQEEYIESRGLSYEQEESR